MDETNTDPAGKRKREWVCEIKLAGPGDAWRPYGQNRFMSADGVKRSWVIQATSWRHGTTPAARARNVVTGEIVAL